jgi:hypothetical protein
MPVVCSIEDGGALLPPSSIWGLVLAEDLVPKHIKIEHVCVCLNHPKNDKLLHKLGKYVPWCKALGIICVKVRVGWEKKLYLGGADRHTGGYVYNLV